MHRAQYEAKRTVLSDAAAVDDMYELLTASAQRTATTDQVASRNKIPLQWAIRPLRPELFKEVSNLLPVDSVLISRKAFYDANVLASCQNLTIAAASICLAAEDASLYSGHSKRSLSS